MRPKLRSPWNSRAQHAGRLPKALVLLELAHQIGGIIRFIGCGWRLRRQRARFDHQQPSGDQQKRRERARIGVAQRADVRQILVGHLGERDRSDVEFGALDQPQQQFERPGKCR